MMHTRFMTTLKRFHQRLNGSTVEYKLTGYENIVQEIKKRGIAFKNKTDYQLKQASQKLSLCAQQDGCLDDLLVDVYALVREVAWRVLHLHPFDVQMIGGIVMHQGKLAEMQTGEGKTLMAVFPAYLNALTGKGIHVLTFNDYLARRSER